MRGLRHWVAGGVVGSGLDMRTVHLLTSFWLAPYTVFMHWPAQYTVVIHCFASHTVFIHFFASNTVFMH